MEKGYESTVGGTYDYGCSSQQEVCDDHAVHKDGENNDVPNRLHERNVKETTTQVSLLGVSDTDEPRNVIHPREHTKEVVSTICDAIAPAETNRCCLPFTLL